VDELPVSISFLVGVEKLLYSGNNVRVNGATADATYAAPNGWGLVVGGSVYRRIEIGTSMLLIPEAVVAYDFMTTHYFSNAMDQSAPSVGDSGTVNGYRQTTKHGVRALGRVNLGFKSDDRVWTVTPYAGVQGTYGTVYGLNVGVVL
jgi:hypothetical protein